MSSLLVFVDVLRKYSLLSSGEDELMYFISCDLLGLVVFSDCQTS